MTGGWEWEWEWKWEVAPAGTGWVLRRWKLGVGDRTCMNWVLRLWKLADERSYLHELGSQTVEVGG